MSNPVSLWAVSINKNEITPTVTIPTNKAKGVCMENTVIIIGTTNGSKIKKFFNGNGPILIRPSTCLGILLLLMAKRITPKMVLPIE